MNRSSTRQTQEKSIQAMTTDTNDIQVNNKVHHTRRKFDPKQAHISRDRCSKCGDSKHDEGFKCTAKKYQCKTYHKYGYFTSLCFKKQAAFKPRAPKPYQLQAEEIYMQDDSICGQTEEFTSSDDSFCLQMQIQCAQAKPKLSTTSHLITNLVYKL